MNRYWSGGVYKARKRAQASGVLGIPGGVAWLFAFSSAVPRPPLQGPGNLASRFELRGSTTFLEPPDGHGVYSDFLPQLPHAQTSPLAYPPRSRALHLHEAHGTLNGDLT